MNEENTFMKPRRSIILTKLKENYEFNQKRKSMTNPDLIKIEKIKISPKNSEINKETDSPKTNNILNNDVFKSSEKNLKSELKVVEKKKKKRCFLFRCFGNKM